MNENSALLAEGGLAALVLGANIAAPRPYDRHPQVLTLHADTLPSSLGEITQKIPTNTKVIVIVGTVPDTAYQAIRATADRRQIPYLVRKNAGAMLATLQELLKKAGPVPPPPADDPVAATNGTHGPVAKVADLIREYGELNSGRSNADEARRLLAIAQGMGFVTTFGSLSQAIMTAKRKSGLSGVPNSIRSQQDKALQTLDDAIAGLQLIRDYLDVTDKENAELRQKLAALRKVLGVEA